MLLFENPKSYAEMTKKISYTVFLFTMFGLFFVSQISSDFSDFMKDISFKMSAEVYGMKLYISLLYIPIVIAILENVFSFHDKLSDLLGIRYRYDKNIVIRHYLQVLNMDKYIDKIDTKNREIIMNEVFYKYASSTSPQIDPHFIYLALGSWSWYWILLDTFSVTLFVGMFLLLKYYSLSALIIIIIVLFSLYAFMFIKRNTDCIKYSTAEVDAILSYRPWKRKVTEYLRDALQNK